jgi:hypothetical protein
MFCTKKLFKLYTKSHPQVAWLKENWKGPLTESEGFPIDLIQANVRADKVRKPIAVLQKESVKVLEREAKKEAARGEQEYWEKKRDDAAHDKDMK